MQCPEKYLLTNWWLAQRRLFPSVDGSRAASLCSIMRTMFGVLALLLVCLSPAVAVEKSGVFSPDLTDEEVREKLLVLIPPLRDPQATPREKIRALRIWLHHFVPAANITTDVSTIVGRSHHQLTNAEMLSLAEQRQAGMLCGGHAELMRRLSLLLGFEAVSINFGVPGTSATHVLAVIRIEHREKPIWIVQDSYFNTGYADESGEPIAFEDLVQQVAAGKAELIRDTKPWHVRAPALTMREGAAGDTLSVSELAWSLETVLTDMPEVRTRLLELTGTAHPAAFLLFPISTSGSAEAERLATLARNMGYEAARQIASRKAQAAETLP